MNKIDKITQDIYNNFDKKNIIIATVDEFIRVYPEYAHNYFSPDSVYQKRVQQVYPDSMPDYTDTCVIYIPENFVSNQVILLEDILKSQDTTLFLDKKLIIISGSQSKVTLNISSYYKQYIYLDYFLDSGAHAIIIDDIGQHGDVYTRLYVGNNAHISYYPIIIDSLLLKYVLDIDLYAPGAQADIRGIYALNNVQNIEIISRQLHNAPHTQSSLIFKGILASQAQLLFKNLIFINNVGSFAQAEQENKTIMLSEQARSQSIPSMEILTDDVQCRHGTAIGQLDLEQLYYLQSRGLSESDARLLIVQAFFSDLQKIIGDNFYINTLNKRIDQKIIL